MFIGRGGRQLFPLVAHIKFYDLSEFISAKIATSVASPFAWGRMYGSRCVEV